MVVLSSIYALIRFVISHGVLRPCFGDARPAYCVTWEILIEWVRLTITCLLDGENTVIQWFRNDINFADLTLIPVPHWLPIYGMSQTGTLISCPHPFSRSCVLILSMFGPGRQAR
jgi:hypothetical protein